MRTILTPDEIVQVLEAAKESFLYWAVKFEEQGMCNHITSQLATHLPHVPVELIRINPSLYIPEFNPVFLCGRKKEFHRYWWPQEDIDSRIQAFDKLINIYKNGK